MKNFALIFLAAILSAPAAMADLNRNYSVDLSPGTVSKDFPRQLRLQVAMSAAASVTGVATVNDGQVCTDNECHPSCGVSLTLNVGTVKLLVTDLDTGTTNESQQDLKVFLNAGRDEACGANPPAFTENTAYSLAQQMRVSFSSGDYPELAVNLSGPKFQIRHVGGNQYEIAAPQFDAGLNGSAMYYGGGKDYYLRAIKDGQVVPVQ